MPVAAKKSAKKSAPRSKSAAAGKPVQKTRSAPRAAKRARVSTSSGLYYRLHALLQTVRSIAQFEDQLCSLTHEAHTTGGLSPESQEELHTLLLDLPASSYHAELDALHEALHGLERTSAAA